MLNYDHLATDYAQHRCTNPGVVRDLVKTGQLTAGKRVLEVGCGTGNYLASLITWTQCTGFGLDPAVAMLALARRHRVPLHLWCGRAEGLASKERAFDLVFSVDVIHHIRDRQRYFAQACRLLRPGGKVCTVTDSEIIIRNREPLARYFPDTIPVELARYPRMAELREMMRSTGFGAVTQTAVSFVDALTDSAAYRDKAFSSLHLISEAAFAAGLARLEADLALGPVRRVSRYVLLWGTKLPA